MRLLKASCVGESQPQIGQTGRRPAVERRVGRFAHHQPAALFQQRRSALRRHRRRAEASRDDEAVSAAVGGVTPHVFRTRHHNLHPRLQPEPGHRLAQELAAPAPAVEEHPPGVVRGRQHQAGKAAARTEVEATIGKRTSRLGEAPGVGDLRPEGSRAQKTTAAALVEDREQVGVAIQPVRRR